MSSRVSQSPGHCVDRAKSTLDSPPSVLRAKRAFSPISIPRYAPLSATLPAEPGQGGHVNTAAECLKDDDCVLVKN